MAALAALAVVAGAAIAIAAGSGTRAPAAPAPHRQPREHGGAQHLEAQVQAQDPGHPVPGDDPGARPDHAAGPDHAAQTPPPAQAKSDDPVALNDQGFALIGQGNAAGAVAPLQRSVEAFRAQGRKGDIGYAYALYNLGNALRLSGHPADAIPFLQERLQVSNYKRGVVKKELKTAQQQAGQ